MPNGRCRSFRPRDRPARASTSSRPVGIKSVVTQGYLPLVAQIGSDRRWGSRPYVIVGEHRVLEDRGPESIIQLIVVPVAIAIGMHEINQDDHLHAGGRCREKLVNTWCGHRKLMNRSGSPVVRMVIGLAVQPSAVTTCGTAIGMGSMASGSAFCVSKYAPRRPPICIRPTLGGIPAIVLGHRTPSCSVTFAPGIPAQSAVHISHLVSRAFACLRSAKFIICHLCARIGVASRRGS